MNGGRVLYRQLLGEFGAVIKKPGPMGRKSNARCAPDTPYTLDKFFDGGVATQPVGN